jgi:hypothetical protein
MTTRSGQHQISPALPGGPPHGAGHLNSALNGLSLARRVWIAESLNQAVYSRGEVSERLQQLVVLVPCSLGSQFQAEVAPAGPEHRQQRVWGGLGLPVAVSFVVVRLAVEGE